MTDNHAAICEQVSMDKDSSTEDLCRKFAMIMKKEKCSPSSFLALYFDEDMLGAHAALLGRSPKGNSTTLAERISNVWARNRADMFDTPWVDADNYGDPRSKKRSIAEAYPSSTPPPVGLQPNNATTNYVNAHGFPVGMVPPNPYGMVPMAVPVPGMTQNFAAPQMFSGMAGQPIGSGQQSPPAYQQNQQLQMMQQRQIQQQMQQQQLFYAQQQRAQQQAQAQAAQQHVDQEQQQQAQQTMYGQWERAGNGHVDSAVVSAQAVNSTEPAQDEDIREPVKPKEPVMIGRGQEQDSGMKPEPNIEPEAEPDAEPQPEPEVEPKAEPQPEPEAEPEQQPEEKTPKPQADAPVE
ncbi:hypothetical protein TL16_g04256 [Triparma laevis f. inornata]|uniref:Uncharacterized protein n=1 Tax=Triparma laevis f. inornata TaxID=1714386 RepID=A0A9W7ADC3_9STRA|nr:hypothetical protein TL16_g04256 [Triparma laevis f. inornata]